VSAAIKPSPMLQRVMVLAAGLGERMRPITDALPKPLIFLLQKRGAPIAGVAPDIRRAAPVLGKKAGLVIVSR